MDAISEAVIQVTISCLSAVLIVLIRYGIAYVKTKTKSVKIQTALTELETVIADGVAFTEQTLVTSLKANDSWTKEAQQECLSKCTQYVVSNLTQETVNLLLTNERDLDAWVVSKIEAYIQRTKTQ